MDRTLNPKKSLIVNGETWELHKSATDKFIEKMRQSHPEEVEEFLTGLNNDLSKFLTYEEAKAYVDAMENEDTDRPRLFILK